MTAGVQIRVAVRATVTVNVVTVRIGKCRGVECIAAG